MAIMASVLSNSFRKKVGQAGKKEKKIKRKEKEAVSVITPNTFVFDVAAVIFPP